MTEFKENLSAPCAVEVKKLEWRKPTDHPQDMEGECSSVANGIGGRYSISNPERNKDGVYGWLLYLADDEFRWEWFPSIGEAKAAAQADFERRVRECVVTKPVDVAAVRRQAFDDACNVIDGYEEYDRSYCCSGHMCGCYGATVHQQMKHYIRALSAEPAQGEQRQPIETAPKDGTEILVWREDCGWMIASYTSLDAFPMSQSELDELDEETLFKKDWFTQFGQYRLEGSEVPTHWARLPAAPTTEAGK